MSCAGQTPRHKDIHGGVLPPLGVRLKIPFCCLRRRSSHTRATSWSQALICSFMSFLVFCAASHPCSCRVATLALGWMMIDLYSRSAVLHSCLMQMPFRPSIRHALSYICGAMMSKLGCGSDTAVGRIRLRSSKIRVPRVHRPRPNSRLSPLVVVRGWYAHEDDR